MFFFPHNFSEYCQGFGISVPMEMNKKKMLFFFFFKECYLWVLDYWYLSNLKTFIIYVSLNVLSYLTDFLGKIIKKNTQNTYF